MCVRVCVCLHYVHAFMCGCVHEHACMRVRSCVCARVCMYVCAFVCVCVRPSRRDSPETLSVASVTIPCILVKISQHNL